jgi:hypothetical protein
MSSQHRGRHAQSYDRVANFCAGALLGNMPAHSARWARAGAFRERARRVILPTLSLHPNHVTPGDPFGVSHASHEPSHVTQRPALCQSRVLPARHVQARRLRRLLQHLGPHPWPRSGARALRLTEASSKVLTSAWVSRQAVAKGAAAAGAEVKVWQASLRRGAPAERTTMLTCALRLPRPCPPMCSPRCTPRPRATTRSSPPRAHMRACCMQPASCSADGAARVHRDLPNADAIIFGVPTRYGTAPAQVCAGVHTRSGPARDLAPWRLRSRPSSTPPDSCGRRARWCVACCV